MSDEQLPHLNIEGRRVHVHLTSDGTCVDLVLPQHEGEDPRWVKVGGHTVSVSWNGVEWTVIYPLPPVDSPPPAAQYDSERQLPGSL